MTTALLPSAHFSPKEDVYAGVVKVLSKLPKKAVRDGCQTFALNGMEQGTMFDCCFVAMMYSQQVGKYEADEQKTHGVIEPAMTKFGKYVSLPELELVSNAHHALPELVFLAACDVLNS